MRLIVNDFFLQHRLCVVVLLALVASLPILASVHKVALLWFVNDRLSISSSPCEHESGSVFYVMSMSLSKFSSTSVSESQSHGIFSSKARTLDLFKSSFVYIFKN